MLPKVLFLTYNLSMGGAQNFLIKLLNELNKEEIEPILISLGKEDELKNRLNHDIKYIRKNKKSKFDFNPFYFIRNVLIEENIKLIYTIDTRLYLFIRFFILRKNLKDIKVIITFHSTNPRNLKEYFINFLYYRFIKKNVILVATTRNQIDFLSSKYLISPNRFQLIYNGVDTDYFDIKNYKEEKTIFKEILGIEKDTFVIIKVAGYRVEKNHETAIKSMKWLIENGYNDIKLLFIGDYNLIREKYLKKIVKDLNLEKYIIFCNAFNVVDVRDYYYISDLFTLTSNCIETLSIAALEATSMRLPCVLTDLGGAREIVQEGFNGFIVNPNNPEEIAKAWIKVKERRLIASKDDIRNIALTKFSLKMSLEKYTTLFNS